MAATRTQRASLSAPADEKDFGRLSKLEPNPTLGGRIYRLLEDAIVKGELTPGQKLDEQVLADHFGVSRIPLREALSGLEVAGWVEKSAGRQGVRMQDDLGRGNGWETEFAAHLDQTGGNDTVGEGGNGEAGRHRDVDGRTAASHERLVPDDAGPVQRLDRP